LAHQTRRAENPDILVPPQGDHGTLPNLRWSFADSHMRLQPGDWARQTTIRELPAATTLAGANMRLKAGAVREMHWHKAAEWAFLLKGAARITAVDEEGRTFQDDVAEGDFWNFPAGIPHSIQGLEGDGCEFLLVFDDAAFSEEETFLLTEWLAILQERFSPRTSTCRKVLSPTFPRRSSTSSSQKCPARWRRTG